MRFLWVIVFIGTTISCKTHYLYKRGEIIFPKYKDQVLYVTKNFNIPKEYKTDEEIYNYMLLKTVPIEINLIEP